MARLAINCAELVLNSTVIPLLLQKFFQINRTQRQTHQMNTITH